MAKISLLGILAVLNTVIEIKEPYLQTRVISGDQTKNGLYCTKSSSNP